MDLTVKIEAGKGTCRHRKVTLTAGGRTYVRVMTEEELLAESGEVRSEKDVWAAALPLLRQEAKAAGREIGKMKAAVESRVFTI